MASVPALDLTTSLRGDLHCLGQKAALVSSGPVGQWDKHFTITHRAHTHTPHAKAGKSLGKHKYGFCFCLVQPEERLCRSPHNGSLNVCTESG